MSKGSDIFNMDYDGKNDILNIYLGKADDTYCDGFEEGIFLMREIETNEIAGVTIMDFKKKMAAGKVSVSKLPFVIDPIVLNRIFTS